MESECAVFLTFDCFVYCVTRHIVNHSSKSLLELVHLISMWGKILSMGLWRNDKFACIFEERVSNQKSAPLVEFHGVDITKVKNSKDWHGDSSMSSVDGWMSLERTFKKSAEISIFYNSWPSFLQENTFSSPSRPPWEMKWSMNPNLHKLHETMAVRARFWMASLTLKFPFLGCFDRNWNWKFLDRNWGLR